MQAIIDVCKERRPDILVLCHGGPISSPDDAQFMLDRCVALDGFYGASSLERVPTEKALTAEVVNFAGLSLGPRRAGVSPAPCPFGRPA